ncbi:MAG: hypothetical protein ABJC79_12040 [Acidimicrobiia bacterium]
MTDDHDTTARQLLHAATGDRDAEAEALADGSDTDPDAARLAIARAHGDVTDRPKADSDLASPEDVRVAQREHENERDDEGFAG